MDEAAGHADDFAVTGGSTIRMILADPEVMAFLETRKPKTTSDHPEDNQFSIADHVRCCIRELDAYEKALEKLRQKYLGR